MAVRTRYLLAYDIRNPKRLRRVHEVAKSWGDPLQYSVFVCDLSRGELVQMKEHLIDEMNLDADSVSIFDLGPPNGRGLECVDFIGHRQPLPDAGPSLW